MKRLLLSLSLWLLCCCAVSAQVPNGVANGVPNAAPSVQVNLNAAADPTVNNDQTQGYQVGSLWQNSATGRIWIARKVSAGAAAWTLLSPGKQPGYVASSWFVFQPYQNTAVSSNLNSNQARCYPGYVDEVITVSQLGARVAATGGAGNISLALYSNNTVTNRPTGTALLSSGSLSAAVATTVAGTSGTFQLSPGVMYWACGNSDTAAAITTLNHGATTVGSLGMLAGSPTQANVLGASGGSFTSVSTTQACCTWPDFTAASWSDNVGTNPYIGVEFLVQSIP